jgi:hypothetical protein
MSILSKPPGPPPREPMWATALGWVLTAVLFLSPFVAAMCVAERTR